ncbi:metallophosphoesterase [uncultured Tateyamaria sp.]|uniref:metallophosphoesterase n=1 Tax=uncultured Tateyamaria sp. TaxID=455651 RepID=UPI002624DD71|nr:metallophosphoesterase [uncultured Tateyamaria sp.]
MIKRLFQRFVGQPDMPDVAPDSPFIAVGDIHGRADLLARFLDTTPPHPIVCVGDYVDRGDSSAEVLRMLRARPDITCLSGNHEVMLLAFLKNPTGEGPRWLHNGGLQTLASFGIASVSQISGAEALMRARDQLYEAMGPDLIAWINGLPAYWQSGNVAVVHAGADPVRKLADQQIDTLHWGHPNFMKTPRVDGIWVVHGHTIVDAPSATQGRIAIDTGAYATGRLTTALVAPGRTTFTEIT